MTQTTIGIIPINDFTQQHEQTLLNLGYAVEREGDEFQIPAEFLPAEGNVYDISSLDKACQFFSLLTRGKRLVSFDTRLELPNGSKKYGRVLCRELRDEHLIEALGYDPSALVAERVECE